MDDISGLFGVILLFVGFIIAIALPAPKSQKSTDDLIAEIVERVGKRLR